MKVLTQKELPNSQVFFEIRVEGEEFQKGLDASYRKNAPKLSVPGFRKGKAPKNLVLKTYGVGILFDDAIGETYPAAYEKAITDAMDKVNASIDAKTKADEERKAQEEAAAAAAQAQERSTPAPQQYSYTPSGSASGPGSGPTGGGYHSSGGSAGSTGGSASPGWSVPANPDPSQLPGTAPSL